MQVLSNPISATESFEVEDAIQYLIRNHNESGRSPKPVLLHAIRVGMLLLEMGYEKDLVIAGILHNIIDDTDVTIDKISSDFNSVIGDMVSSVSYNDAGHMPFHEYKVIYDQIIRHGRSAVVLKAVHIAVSSLYIYLEPDVDRQRELVDKEGYFLEFSKKFSEEPAWKLLQQRNIEEQQRLRDLLHK